MPITIIGYLAGNQGFNDGQSVKTRTLCCALSKLGITINSIDTYYVKRKPLGFLWRLGSSLFCSRKYIVLVSSNGRKFLFPILYVFAKIFKKQIYHDVIGGRLADEVQSAPYMKRFLNAFCGNWVESRLLEKQLRELGVTNATYVPNFKLISPLSSSELPAKPNMPLRFCTFSRVVQEKGISDAIEALAQLNGEKIVATLDIYGSIAMEYQQEFETLCSRYQHFCTYVGVIDADKSIATLKNYDMLLFPTYWPGEGMPGTIIDALCAGLPVLARHWTYCDEMITHLKTGLVYDSDKPEKLTDWLNYAVTHPQEVYAMKSACLSAGAAYTAQAVVPQIVALLQGGK